MEQKISIITAAASRLRTIVMLFMMFVVFFSCRFEELDLQNPDPDLFVKLIKNSTFHRDDGNIDELPDFKLKHIKKLMGYIDDGSAVDFFPVNPLSSKYTDPKILNECLMWTIDGIRYGKKYPSLEPCLMDTLTYMRITDNERKALATKYKSWHDEYTKNPSETLKKKNLLEGTTYKWQ